MSYNFGSTWAMEASNSSLESFCVVDDNSGIICIVDRNKRAIGWVVSSTLAQPT